MSTKKRIATTFVCLMAIALVAIAALGAGRVQAAPSRDVRTGTWSVRAVISSSESWSKFQQQGVSIATNSTYVASMWIKGSGQISLNVVKGDWSGNFASAVCTATSSWTQCTTPSFSTGSYTTAVFSIYDDRGVAGTLYADDTFLGISGGANRITNNPGFESGNTGWENQNTNVYTILQNTATATKTNTPLYTATRTNTPVPPTATKTNTPIGPTPTRTNTPVPPTATKTYTPTPTSGGSNLLLNPGFELDWANWTDASGGPTASITTSDVHGGSKAAELSNWTWRAQARAISPNTSYTIAGWGKRVSGTGPCTFEISSDVTFTNASVSFTSSSWAYQSSTFTSPASWGWLFEQMMAQDSTCRFDDMSLTSGGGGPTPTKTNTPVGPTATPGGETIGGGSKSNPAQGPDPSYSGAVGSGYTLVKNWNFGTNGTIKNYSDMSANFYYHDQFGTIGNGTNYGALMVSPDSENALDGQPIEGVDTTGPVRSFLSNSMKTLLVPLDGATTCKPTSHNAGSGSFMAKWKLAHGGSLLGQDILWETSIRYVTPPYFWFAIWTAGNQWEGGAEMDVVESFGYDNGGGNTNYDGRYWHSNSVGGSDQYEYDDWEATMSSVGVTNFDGTQYHVWQWLYRTNNTYSVYMDGINVQNGTMYWTLSGIDGGTPIDMDFLFDGTWGHTQVSSVNKSLACSEFTGKYYEWDYSRVYLR